MIQDLFTVNCDVYITLLVAFAVGAFAAFQIYRLAKNVLASIGTDDDPDYDPSQRDVYITRPEHLPFREWLKDDGYRYTASGRCYYCRDESRFMP